jgi:tRNA-splicing ligase RtcB
MSARIYGDDHDEVTLEQYQVVSRGSVGSVLCADGHRGKRHPIGCAVALENAISLQGIGPDIGCGNDCTLLDIPLVEVRRNIGVIMDDIVAAIPFGAGRSHAAAPDDPLFEDPAWGHVPWLGAVKARAAAQLGTVGGGNHYVDLFHDEEGLVWLGCHFGSRGLGFSHYAGAMAVVGSKDDDMGVPDILDLDGELGRVYRAGMELAGRYAAAGRRWVLETIRDRILRARSLDWVANHHNYAWEEEVDGRSVWVTRKGATPNRPGLRSFVGGSMGDCSVILRGTDRAADALYTTVHGAGRVLGRAQARGKPARPARPAVGKQAAVPANPGRPGLVSREMMGEWVGRAGIELRGGDVDESPHCYRRLPEVLAAMGDTVEVIHTLTPIGVAMAPRDWHDPYKD